MLFEIKFQWRHKERIVLGYFKCQSNFPRVSRASLWKYFKNISCVTITSQAFCYYFYNNNKTKLKLEWQENQIWLAEEYFIYYQLKIELDSEKQEKKKQKHFPLCPTSSQTQLHSVIPDFFTSSPWAPQGHEEWGLQSVYKTSPLLAIPPLAVPLLQCVVPPMGYSPLETAPTWVLSTGCSPSRMVCSRVGLPWVKGADRRRTEEPVLALLQWIKRLCWIKAMLTFISKWVDRREIRSSIHVIK